MLRTATAFVAILLLPAAGHAQDADPIAEAISKIKPTIDLRLRHEFADQSTGTTAGAIDHANATTARLRLGALSPVIGGFQGFIEVEHTEAWDRDSYNAAGVHGNASRPTIADPESSELNRAWISYVDEGTSSTFKLGRQRIILDGARFIGNVGWRQNEQTYDAITFVNEGAKEVRLFYGYVWNVNRIFGSDAGDAGDVRRDFNSTSHLVNAQFNAIPQAKLTVYGYWLDIENGRTFGTATGGNNGNRTIGASLTGTLPLSDQAEVGYLVEYAEQEDAGQSHRSYETHYSHAKVWAKLQGQTIGFAQETLGSDRDDNSGASRTQVGFNTPLATGHKWNGFADHFLTTPSVGLVDRYAFASLALPNDVVLKGWYHDFRAESGSGNIGSEIDLVLARKFKYGITGLLKYADFDSDGNPTFRAASFKPDLRRFWAQVEFKY